MGLYSRGIDLGICEQEAVALDLAHKQVHCRGRSAVQDHADQKDPPVVRKLFGVELRHQRKGTPSQAIYLQGRNPSSQSRARKAVREQPQRYFPITYVVAFFISAFCRDHLRFVIYKRVRTDEQKQKVASLAHTDCRLVEGMLYGCRVAKVDFGFIGRTALPLGFQSLKRLLPFRHQAQRRADGDVVTGR